MKELYVREIESTDEKQINNLYRIITAISRTSLQFKWEWIDTWDGKGSSWLMFDDSKEVNNQLICQYSLIPTPISYYGRSIVAGKTENCMSHPDIRGKKLYFPHEETFFKEAKKRFDIFFTTTGEGAPGRIRRKLGYIAFDYWIEYAYFNKKENIYDLSNNSKSIKKSTFYFIYTYYILKKIKNLVRIKITDKKHTYKVFDSNNSPLKEIDLFWKKNKHSFNITIDRTSKYLAWRIDDNPYFDYKYLVIYNDENVFKGYLIYKKYKNKYSIEDLMAENGDEFIFNLLFEKIINIAKKDNVDLITCTTLNNNIILKKAFSNSSFTKIDPSILSKIKNKLMNQKNNDLKPFHLYIKPQVDNSNKGVDPKNWYVTALFKEGVK